MRRLLAGTLLALTLAAALALPAGAGAARPATPAERAGVLAAAPLLARADRCAGLQIEVEERFAAAWVPERRVTEASIRRCGAVQVSQLTDPTVFRRDATGWTVIGGVYDELPCSLGVPVSLLFHNTPKGRRAWACTAGPARATSLDFQLPSGDAGCAVEQGDLPALHCTVRGGVRDSRWIEQSCLSPAFWLVVLDNQLRAGEDCGPPIAFDPASARVLPAGTRLTVVGVTCTIETARLTCLNRNGSGFELSRSRQAIVERPTAGWRPVRDTGDTSFSVRIGSTEIAHCRLSTSADFTNARCDGTLVPIPSRSSVGDDEPCDIAGLALDAAGPGRVSCVGDTVQLYLGGAPLLPVGRTVTAGPFRCTATATAFSCTRADGHGFAWSAGHRWRVF